MTRMFAGTGRTLALVTFMFDTAFEDVRFNALPGTPWSGSIDHS